MDGIRPYRSHKFPACVRCRKRKIRCIVEEEGQSCLLCRNQKVDCTRTESGSVSRRRNAGKIQSNTLHSSEPTSRSPAAASNRNIPAQRVTSSFSRKRASLLSATVVQDSEESTTQHEQENRSSFIVGPVTAEDIRIVTQHVSNQSPAESRGRSDFNTLLDNEKDPVLYLQLPRHRRGLLPLQNEPGRSQRETIEQILGPLKEEVIGLYFKHIHPSFPVLDEDNFLNLVKSQNDSLSSALVCDVLTMTLVYWNLSESLKAHHKPDSHYTWNLAVSALQEEYLAPGISTLCASLLDLAGRPTTALIGNTINCGRSVALANSLGLNRNPETWRLSSKEKMIRIRLWWGTLIHDRWSSFAHGVPGNIVKHQYDVPMPTVDILVTMGKESLIRREAATCFIALCGLTEILGDILPLVYDVQQRIQHVNKVLRKLEVDLDTWEDSVEVTSIFDREEISVPGASSLKLGFLAVKMLIKRVGLFAATRNSASSQAAEEYARILLCESAQNLATYICSLDQSHLEEFWLPYAAYHIASAVIILLRRIIDGNDTDKEKYLSVLRRLRIWLQWASETGWDLADLCLSQFGDYIDQLARHSQVQEPGNAELTDRESDGLLGTLNGNGMPFEARDWAGELGYPFADLWDMFPWDEAGEEGGVDGLG